MSSQTDIINLQAYVASSLNRAGFKAGQQNQGLHDELIDTIYGTTIRIDDLADRVIFIAHTLFCKDDRKATASGQKRT